MFFRKRRAPAPPPPKPTTAEIVKKALAIATPILLLLLSVGLGSSEAPRWMFMVSITAFTISLVLCWRLIFGVLGDIALMLWFLID